MHIDAFDYTLPKALIAEHSMSPREAAKLLVLHRATKELEHKHVRDVADYIQPGDLIILNNTKVFKARLTIKHADRAFEIFFLRPDAQAPSIWQVLLRPAKLVHINDALMLPDGSTVSLITKNTDGVSLIETHCAPEEIFAMLQEYGEVPTPPYVTSTEKNRADYQTVYAEKVGSVAAPTAGFHLTRPLMNACQDHGAVFADVTLHVGLGTFRPMRTEYLHDHVMHEEWIHLPKETIRRIKETKARGGRVIAIGTTAARALESLTIDRVLEDVPDEDMEGFTKLFITPGFPFKILDGLLTNFHLPKSTLLVLVSAFAGQDMVLDAYAKAIENEYRFYSFGDAMLII